MSGSWVVYALIACVVFWGAEDVEKVGRAFAWVGVAVLVWAIAVADTADWVPVFEAFGEAMSGE